MVENSDAPILTTKVFEDLLGKFRICHINHVNNADFNLPL